MGVVVEGDFAHSRVAIDDSANNQFGKREIVGSGKNWSSFQLEYRSAEKSCEKNSVVNKGKGEKFLYKKSDRRRFVGSSCFQQDDTVSCCKHRGHRQQHR